MKKFFAVFAMFGILSFGLSQTVVAQNERIPNIANTAKNFFIVCYF